MNEAEKVEPTEDLMQDIDPIFHGVVRKHGRSMFALVMSAGMGGEAARVAGEVFSRQHSSHGIEALRTLISVFNQVSNAYVTQMGWTQEQLGACEQDIKVAFAGKLEVVKSPIVLLH